MLSLRSKHQPMKFLLGSIVVLALLASHGQAQVKNCNTSTHPFYRNCAFQYENQASVILQGIRGTDVFINLKNVTDVVLDDIELTATAKRTIGFFSVFYLFRSHLLGCFFLSLLFSSFGLLGFGPPAAPPVS